MRWSTKKISLWVIKKIIILRGSKLLLAEVVQKKLCVCQIFCLRSKKWRIFNNKKKSWWVYFFCFFWWGQFFENNQWKKFLIRFFPPLLSMMIYVVLLGVNSKSVQGDITEYFYNLGKLLTAYKKNIIAWITYSPRMVSPWTTNYI